MNPAPLVLVLLSPALALANPTDRLDRKVEVEAANPDDAAVTLTGDTPAGGNPLWTIPLSALSATRERPLFSASRRPPTVASPAASLPEEPPSAPAAPPPERPQLSLMGTIVGSESSVALLKDSGSRALLRLHIGQENSGWRVQGIDSHSIVLEKGGQTITLDLPKPSEPPAPEAPGADQ
jgi:general secretion pathway protein N